MIAIIGLWNIAFTVSIFLLLLLCLPSNSSLSSGFLSFLQKYPSLL